jgi:putative membrane protein
MKNLIKASGIILIIVSVSFLQACNSGQNSNNNMPMGQNQAAIKDSLQNKNNSQFVVEVAAANYYEIGVSKYAASSTANKDVKGFAEMMVTDHTKALDNLKAVAQRQNIMIPSEDTAKVNSTIKSWQGKAPEEFNKAYISKMVDDHKATLDKLNKADTAITNTDIHSWIEATLPVVKEHLQKVSDLQKSEK